MSDSSLMPEGENLRRAIQWISDQQKHDPAEQMIPEGGDLVEQLGEHLTGVIHDVTYHVDGGTGFRFGLIRPEQVKLVSGHFEEIP